MDHVYTKVASNVTRYVSLYIISSAYYILIKYRLNTKTNVIIMLSENNLTVKLLVNPLAAGYPTVPSMYGYSNAGIVAYNVTCNGTESRVEDCDRFPDSSPFCLDPATSAAGVVCVSTGTPNNQ